MDTQTATMVRLLADYEQSMSMAGESKESHEFKMQKYLLIISALLLLAALLTTWLSPATSPIVGMLSLFLGLALSTHTIIHKHKGTKNARAKILKEASVMVLTLIIILFLGGIAAMLANAQVGIRFGEIAGIVSAIGASFLVGYLVRKGMMRFAR